MNVGLVAKQQTVQKKADTASTASNTASVKDGLKGKSYDEQVQMLKPPDEGQAPAAEVTSAPAPAPTDKTAAPAPTDKTAAPAQDGAAPAAEAQTPGAEGEMSEADQLRASVAGRAADKSGKQILSAEAKAKAVAGSANFTTCIEFARSTMSEGSAELYKEDAKKAQATGAAMSDAKVAWENAQGERTKARNYEGYAAKYKVTVDEYTKKADDATAQATELRTPVEGEADGKFKQRKAQAAGLDGLARQYKSVAAQYQKHVDNYTKMADSAKAKADELDRNNKAMIKAAPGLGSRPKVGEFIILEQAEGKMFGRPGSEVFLAQGSFKHIAVFMGLVADDGQIETWKVTEGGGDIAGTNEIRVRKSDLIVGTKYDGGSDLGSGAGSRLGGWIDAGELIKMRDGQKKGGGKS